jgi:peptide-methionine (S)-S-oxide reductase
LFNLFRSSDKLRVPAASEALAGRPDRPFQVSDTHAVLESPMDGPWPVGTELALVGLGCFWGAERIFWTLDGVISTQVGYAGGHTPNPTYKEVCGGQTGHTEVVRIAFDPAKISYADVLRVFFENHDPTQGMRQGNDVGTQYRSAVYAYDDGQLATAKAVKAAYNGALKARGLGAITTEIAGEQEFYFAEDYHQQYLHKNPGGYCGIGGTGVSCPIGVLDEG